MDSNTSNSSNTSNTGDWSVPQSEAWITYHSAEALVEADHGMEFIGGIGGFWTNPTKGNPAEAAQLMQIAADLRCQSIVYKGGNPDSGHLSSFIAAQDAANKISSGNYAVSDPTITSRLASYPANDYSSSHTTHSSNQGLVQNFGYINGLVAEQQSLERRIESIEQQLRNLRQTYQFDMTETLRLSNLQFDLQQKLSTVKVNQHIYYTNQRPI